uniref:Transcription factor IIIC subunit 5 HTH domain-containing protein n=1 Tax=Parascaris univalens TaxID=6257 RepID=A0A914ZJH1_PARUN
VSTIYTFKSMCDFQFLPLTKKNPTDTHYEDLVPRLVPVDLPSALSWWHKPDIGDMRTPLFLPPYQFSRYNTPSAKILSRELDFSLEKMKRKSGGHGQSLRMERKALSVTVHADEEFPKAPTEEAIRDANLRCKNEEPHRLLQELFEERPMWTRIAILRRTGLEDFLLKSLLQKYAFYILNGPWGRLWCRFGYDPRIDPKAKMYQSVMVTFRQHSKIPERQRLKVNTERVLPSSLSSSTPVPYMSVPFGQAAIETIDYGYSPGQLPRVRQMWYCICDVRLPLAEEIVRKEYFAQGDRADDQHGWLPPDAIDRIREAIKEDVKKVSQQLDEDEEVEGVDMADEEWM